MREINQESFFIDESIVQELRDRFGIEYVEGMEITSHLRKRIGQIIEDRVKRQGSISFSNGEPDSQPSGELEEY